MKAPLHIYHGLYTFLFASLMVSIFGAGVLSLDALILKRYQERA